MCLTAEFWVENYITQRNIHQPDNYYKQIIPKYLLVFVQSNEVHPTINYLNISVCIYKIKNLKKKIPEPSWCVLLNS